MGTKTRERQEKDIAGIKIVAKDKDHDGNKRQRQMRDYGLEDSDKTKAQFSLSFLLSFCLMP